MDTPSLMAPLTSNEGALKAYRVTVPSSGGHACFGLANGSLLFQDAAFSRSVLSSVGERLFRGRRPATVPA